MFGLNTEESWHLPWWFMRSRIKALLDTHSRLAQFVSERRRKP